MSNRRLIACAASALLLSGLVAAPVALAAAPASPGPASPAQLVGRLAYVTKGNVVDVSTVTTSGAQGSPTRIGPITKPATGRTVRIDEFVGSGDGDFVAWDEDVFGNHGRRFVRSTLVDYDVINKTTFHLATEFGPIGFAGDALVVNDGDTTKQLDLQPTTHLVKVNDKQSPIGTYPSGVVDSQYVFPGHGTSHTDVVRLTSFGGAHSVLHRYLLTKNQYDDPDQAWASGDGKHLVIERGNHQDFGGLGPSSLADEFSLTGTHHRSQLGHFGSAKDAWRIADVSFAGATDSVWAAWERATRTGAVGVVAKYVNGHWKRVAANAIAVAGNPAGYTVVQLGKFVVVKPEIADAFTTVPTGHADLMHAGVATVLPFAGSAFVWVDTPS